MVSQLTVAFISLLGMASTTQGPLEWPTVVTEGGLLNFNQKSSAAGQIFEYGWYSNVIQGYKIYDLSGKYSRFEAWAGVPDDCPFDTDHSGFRIEVDGEVIKNGTVKLGGHPSRVAIDLIGAKSFRVDLKSCYLFEPRFIKADSLEAKTPENVSPGSGAKVKRRLTTFVWSSVTGATSYAIEVVAVKFDSPAKTGDKRLWTFSGSEEPTCAVDLSGFSPGEYRWAVMAFDDTRSLGAFSKSSRMVVIGSH